VYTEASRDFETHEAIMKVAASLLGPSAETLAVVKATLDALKSTGTSSPWITLFNRESRSANTARFQINLIEEGYR
jgi:ribosomal protein S5